MHLPRRAGMPYQYSPACWESHSQHSDYAKRSLFKQLRLRMQAKGFRLKRSRLWLSAHTGVGLRGMRERLRQLGGTLQIQSNGHGTRVIAVLPVACPMAVPAQEVGQRDAPPSENLQNSPLLGSVEQVWAVFSSLPASLLAIDAENPADSTASVLSRAPKAVRISNGFQARFLLICARR